MQCFGVGFGVGGRLGVASMWGLCAEIGGLAFFLIHM